MVSPSLPKSFSFLVPYLGSGLVDTKQNYFLKSWNRFVTRNLDIKPDLLGRFHRFPFKGATVTIRLPKKNQVDRGSNFDEVASCESFRVIDGIKVAENIHVHKIDVEVAMNATASLLPSVLNLPCNNYASVDAETQGELNEYCTGHRIIAAQAFDYWLSVLRWTCDNYAIGRHAVIDNSSGWPTYLHEVSSNRKVWIGSMGISIPGTRALTSPNWRTAAGRLRGGAKAEAYLTILHEAEEYLERGEYRRALIDMAVAAELYIRAACMSRLPATLSSYLVKKIDRIGITEFSEQVFPGILTEEDLKKFNTIKSSLREMFEARNQVMHMADYGVANEPLCRKFLASVKLLVTLSRIRKLVPK